MRAFRMELRAARLVSAAVAVATSLSPEGAAPQDSSPSSLTGLPSTVRWALQRPDLVRYNRIEALSLGVRAQVRPSTFAGPLSLTGTVRVGVADLEPNASLDVSRETLRRRVSVRVYHELAAIDEAARHFGIANSILAATVGRDDGDYYRRSGVTLQWTPPTAGRRSFRVRGFVEHQRVARVETDFALARVGSESWSFRPNIVADRGWEYGVSAELSPQWGSDPNRMQVGIDLTGQAAGGDFRYVRASLLGHFATPLPGRLRLEGTAGAGSVWGSPSAQRLWYLGGPATLRGYDPRTAGGESFGRARAQIGRGFSFGLVAVFSDLGWAGPRNRLDWDDALLSVGAGTALVDDIVRVDGAWGVRGPREFRLDVYLDRRF